MNTTKKRYWKSEILRLSALASIVVALMFGMVLTSGKAAPTKTASDLRTLGTQSPYNREEPFNLIHSAFLERGSAAQQTVASLPPDASSYEPFKPSPVASVAMIQQIEKIHPLLQQRLKASAINEHERVVINFRDTVAIPRFPGRVVSEPSDSPNNLRANAEAQRLVDDTKAQRAAEYAALGNELTAKYQAKVLETFWLVKAVLAEIPLAAVQAVADRADVLYVSPQVSGEPPPVVSQGRAVIASDPYFDANGFPSFFALLDSGVRSTHATLSTQFSPYNGFLGDCVFGDSNCHGGNP